MIKKFNDTIYRIILKKHLQLYLYYIRIIDDVDHH